MLYTQLQKLQTDPIDYYLLHSLDEAYWKKLQNFGALELLTFLLPNNTKLAAPTNNIDKFAWINDVKTID